jgi:hypothetical protein
MFVLSRSQSKRAKAYLSCLLGIACCTVSMGAAASQYISVEEHIEGKAGATADVTAHCPAGFQLTGGGFDMYPGDHLITYYYVATEPVSAYQQITSFAPRIVVAISRPNDAGDGWRVAGFVNEDLTLYAWARCKSAD